MVVRFDFHNVLSMLSCKYLQLIDLYVLFHCSFSISILSPPLKLFPTKTLKKLESNKATVKKSPGLMVDIKKAAANTIAAIAIGSSVLSSPIVADAVDYQPPVLSSTNVVAVKEVRQGVYQDYEADIDQEYDDARSTFKSAKETKSKKGTLEMNYIRLQTIFTVLLLFINRTNRQFGSCRDNLSISTIQTHFDI